MSFREPLSLNLSFPKNSAEWNMPAAEGESGKLICHEGVLQPLERDKNTPMVDLGTERLRGM